MQHEIGGAPTSSPRSTRSTSTASGPPRSAPRCGSSASSALLPSGARCEDDGRTWWLWTCLAGSASGSSAWSTAAPSQGARRSRPPVSLDAPRRRRAGSSPARTTAATAEHFAGWSHGRGRRRRGALHRRPRPARRPDPRRRLRHGPGGRGAAGARATTWSPPSPTPPCARSRRRPTPTSRCSPTRRSRSTPPSSARFDVVVVVGNVMVYLGEGTEVAVLARVRDLLAPGGRALRRLPPRRRSRPAAAPTRRRVRRRRRPQRACAWCTGSAATSCTSPTTSTPCGCWTRGLSSEPVRASRSRRR